MKEIWEDIKNYENIYKISNLGNVIKINKDYRSPKFHFLKLKKEKNGYIRVCLNKNAKSKYYNVHRLVAEAFLPNPNNLPIVNHKDENKSNNNVNNLEWCSYKYNSNYGNVRKKLSNKSFKIKVNQYDKNMNLLNSFNSIKEASILTNSNSSWISQCCKKHQLTCNGFYWRYADK